MWLSGKESTGQCRRCEFDPWVRKIPWRRKWQSTSVFLPWKSHGQRSQVGWSMGVTKESDTIQQLSNNFQYSQNTLRLSTILKNKNVSINILFSSYLLLLSLCVEHCANCFTDVTQSPQTLLFPPIFQIRTIENLKGPGDTQSLLITVSGTVCVCSVTSITYRSLQPNGDHGILQGRILEWFASPLPGDLPDSGIEPMSLMSLALVDRFFTTSATWEARQLVRLFRLVRCYA